MDLAPIVLFVYNRPWHTLQTLEALSKNELADQSVLYIYADGAKEGATQETMEKVSEVRTVIRSQLWCMEVHIIERDENWGLADNIVDGVTKIVNQYGKIIVLEDDIVTSPYFLRFINEGLEKYRDSENIFTVNGYIFPMGVEGFPDTFLSPLGISTWGWGTWAKRWAIFEWDMKSMQFIANNLYFRNRFNFGGYDYLNMSFNKNSWGIRWYYAVFLKNGLGVFPTYSLVKNIGMDGTGVHRENNASNRGNRYEGKIEHFIKDSIDMEKNILLSNYLQALSNPTKKKSRIRTFLSTIKRMING